MFAVLRRFGLPLLVKELQEQAARRRTYIVRVAYATLFFFACMTIILPEMSRAGNSGLSVLGIGRNIFIGIVGWQFAGIYLFLPALACSVLTIEKERNTLGLLFLTKLEPWTIIFEKLLSRLLPMYCLIFCSMPLLAFCMSFGGVNTVDMFVAVWFLSLTAFQICSIAVACSSFFRTTTAALLTCYALMFMIGFGLPTADWLIHNELTNFIRNIATPLGVNSNYAEIMLLSFVGFVGFIVQLEGPLGTMTPGTMFAFNLAMGVPLIASGLFALLIARICLVRRAFLPPKNLVLNLLRVLDRCFHTLNNNRVTRGIVVIKESASEPYFSPIAWRETHKRSLGQVRYLIRVLLALEVPVLLVVVSVIGRSAGSSGDGDVPVIITTVLVWLVSALLITVTSAGLIAGERGRQTLDILLTLPLQGRRIILEKIAGVQRLAWVCTLPLVTCILFEGMWRSIVGTRPWGQYQHFDGPEYMITSLSMVAIYIPLLIWLSLWIGLKVKSPTWATLTALAVVVSWCIVPLVVILTTWQLFISTGRSMESEGLAFLLQLSPIFLFYQSEFDSLHDLSHIPL
ncbi:MAG: hypothetical protein JWN70_4984, partial [Planctomycetaceae bacterium]|nr:hypothetical protein [Planctomycetaceae bacterium]